MTELPHETEIDEPFEPVVCELCGRRRCACYGDHDDERHELDEQRRRGWR